MTRLWTSLPICSISGKAISRRGEGKRASGAMPGRAFLYRSPHGGDFGGATANRPFVRPGAGIRGGQPTGSGQEEKNSLSHTAWNSEHHIRWRQNIYGKIEGKTGEMLRALCEGKGMEIKAAACPDTYAGGHTAGSIPKFMGYREVEVHG